MAKIREEIVGKRFLSVSSGSKLKLSKINEWDWRAGVIRACSHSDSKHPDLQVLVEYDDVEWQRREWVHVYRGQLFQIFLLEKTLAWATRTSPKMRSQPIPWPALVYVGLVDQAGISEHKYRPVEYLVDRTLDYHDYTQLQPYQDGECAIVCGEECGRAVRAWVGEQDGQRILLTTPSVLVGFRVQVYRAEGTTQWYTAVIVGYNHATRELTVTDDTVLEEHSEDPSLVQIRLIGEGVVESILRGENVGITPRRSRTATNNHHQTGVRHIRRDGVVPARTRKNSLSRPNNLPPTASHTLPPAPTHPPLPPPLPAASPTTTTAATITNADPPAKASSPAPATAVTTASSSSSSSSSSSTPTALKPAEPPPPTEDQQKPQKGEQQQRHQKGELTRQQKGEQQKQQKGDQQKQSKENAKEETKEEEKTPGELQLAKEQLKQQQRELKEEQKQREAKEKEEQKQREQQQKEDQKKRELQLKEEQKKRELQQKEEQKKREQQQKEEQKKREQEQKEEQKKREQQQKEEQKKREQQQKEEQKKREQQQKEEQKKREQQLKEEQKKREQQAKEEQKKRELQQKEEQKKKEQQQKEEQKKREQQQKEEQKKREQQQKEEQKKKEQQQKEEQKKREAQHKEDQKKRETHQKEEQKQKEQQEKDEEDREARDSKQEQPLEKPRKEHHKRDDHHQQKQQQQRHHHQRLRHKEHRHARERHAQQEKEQKEQQEKEQQVQQAKEKVKEEPHHPPRPKDHPQAKERQARVKEEDRGGGTDPPTHAKESKKKEEAQNASESDSHPQQALKSEPHEGRKPSQHTRRHLQRQTSDDSEQETVVVKKAAHLHIRKTPSQQEIREQLQRMEGRLPKQIKEQTPHVVIERLPRPKEEQLLQRTKQHQLQKAKAQREQKEQQAAVKEESSSASPEKKDQQERDPPLQEKKQFPQTEGEQQSSLSKKEDEAEDQQQQRSTASKQSPESPREDESPRLKKEVKEHHQPSPEKEEPAPQGKEETPAKKDSHQGKVESLQQENQSPLEQEAHRDLKSGKCGGVIWRKRGAGRVRHERPQTRTQRRGHYRTPSRPTRRILTRLEKQSSSEDSCSSSSSSSSSTCTTPDRRPTRPPPRQSKVQSKSREADHAGAARSIGESISGEHSSSSNSSTSSSSSSCSVTSSSSSSSSTSSSSSSTPEPELPTRAPSRRLAAAVALRHTRLIAATLDRPTPSPPSPPTHAVVERPIPSPPTKAALERTTPSPPVKATSERPAASPPSKVSGERSAPSPQAKERPGKRGSPNNGATRRPPQRCRSVSPGTHASHLAAAPCPTNNENNRNTGNCENSGVAKSQKRKSNSSPPRGQLAAPRHTERESRPLSPSQHSHSKTSRKDSHSTDGSSSEEPVVIYEKTTYRPAQHDTHRTPPGAPTKNPNPPSPQQKEVPKKVEPDSHPKEETPLTKSSPPPTPNEAPKSVPPKKEELLPVSVSSTTPAKPAPKSPPNEGTSTAPREESKAVSVVSTVRPPEKPNPRVPKSLPLDEVHLSVSSGTCRNESVTKSLPPDVVIVPADPPHEESKSQRERVSEGVPRVGIVAEPSLDLNREPALRVAEGPEGPPSSRECKRATCSSSSSTSTCTTSLSTCSSSSKSAVNSAPAFCSGESSRVKESALGSRSSGSASVDQGRFANVTVSQHDTYVTNGVVGHSASSVVVSSVAAPLCDGVTAVPSVTSVSIVAGTPSAIVSAVAWSSDSSKVSTTGSSSGNSSVLAGSGGVSSRGCGEVAGVVSGRAVTITATSGPGPTCASRVASPPCVSITAVVRSPAALQPANPDPLHQAPLHHDGAAHAPLHHHHLLHHSQHHHHQLPPQQQQQPQSQHTPQQQQSQQVPSSSAPAATSTRMDHCDGSSDSGVSVTERSVSRSSVLSDDRSSSAEVKPNTPTPTSATVPNKTSQASSSSTSSSSSSAAAPLVLDRKEAIRVWRDPSLVSQSEHTVRHIHSVQHNAMSQHYPGVPPPHHAPPPSGGGSAASHAPAHHSSHGQPPVSLAHNLPPGLPYPAHPTAAAASLPLPQHLPPGLPQPLAAAAAGLYPISPDVWKQLGGPVPALPHAYAGLLSHHQEEFLQMERARELERAERDRMLRERREAEVREKERLAKEKMERERTERERREREDRERREKERREQEEKERQQYQVDQHFNKTFRLAQQKKVSGWNTIPGLVKPERIDAIGDRRLLEQQQQRQEEPMRRAHEPEKMVHESIFKAFRDTDRSQESLGKIRYPPPAHSSKPSEKSAVSSGLPKLADPSFNLATYPPNYLPKEAKPPHSERVPYLHYPDPRDKASVIIQPEIKYEKAPPHSISPKQRPPDRTSPYTPGSAYKPHEPSPSLHRSSTSHHPTSLSHSVELTKARQPQSSPHSTPSPAHPERYYPPGVKPPPTTYPSNFITAGLVPNPMHVSSVSAKPKVSSPPPQIYGKPGITTGTPVCRPDSRPPQPLPLTSKAGGVGGPPPAHSGRGVLPESRPPMPPHEQRPPMERSPYDARIYPPTVPSPHHKHVVAPGPSPARITPVSSPHVATPHIPPHPSPQPTQTQPLDLGTREDAASPSKRRTQTPTPQDPKKPRVESAPSQPLLSRVSEPSPLYPTAATTITTVENTVALAANISRVASPASRPPSQPPAATTPTLQRTENSSSPGATKMAEPEKSNSPGPAGGYVHKLKKAWLQRHESGVEIIPPTTTPSSAPTPPPASSTPTSSKPTSTSTTVVKSEPKVVVRKPKVVNSIPNSIPNGHSQDIKDGDTSSTDSEASVKHKRGKGKRKLKRMKKSSDSNSESEKDSDASEETNLKKSGRIPSKPDSEPKKRGRKPKSKLDKDKEEGPKPKKSKEEPPQNDPLQKPPVSQLKKTGESFLQDGSCYEVAPKLPKCRECRWTAHQRNKKTPNIFCRFYAFRRLRYTKNGQLAVAGFSDPIKDVSADDLKLWVPDSDHPPEDLDEETSQFLLTHVGDQFCDLVEQEKEAMALHMGDDSVVAWKRVVQGVREMCDVCETTLFNIHWACSKCGFVVCIDCYKGRKNGTVKVWDEGGKDRDEYSWLLCASRLPHEQDKLMLTQIISGNALLELGKKVHEVRHKWNIPQYCDCPEAKKYKEQASQDEKKKLNGVNKDLLKNIKKDPSKSEMVNGTVKQEKTEKMNGKDEEMSNSPLNFFADVALSSDKRDSESSDSDSDSDSDDKEGNFSTLRELLIRPNARPNGGAKDENTPPTKASKETSKKKPKLDTVDEVISCVIENTSDKEDVKDNDQMVLKHFVRKYNYTPRGREPLPIRIMTKTESSTLYPGVAHAWLCDGKLLRLQDPLAPSNTAIFQDQWKRGQPVIISGVGQKLSQDLWKPAAFSKDFGDIKNDLINCLTGNIVPNQPMKKFWDGFENYGKRLKDEKGQPMVLKLKDWPPGDDFAEMLPSRFEDLMSVLPMGEYTRRNGRLNLAGRLPECFVRPDLGPKMYIAYGSAIHPSRASTNLHLDISDAVNVMCYVGVPKDADYEDHIKAALKAIDEAGCDVLTRRRVREKEEVPGALWHIYHARDADKIRDLLNKVAIERGDKLEPHHDPIHDQSWYLDGPLRERLYKEYGVEGYAIIQCLGDAVFIPAGAPHQVRNLHNCVKVAEDFVSPENISYCFHLTQEFRHLSDTHTNHEDKLQIKNIIYHDMKDSIACLLAASKKIEATNIEVKEDPEKKIKKETDS